MKKLLIELHSFMQQKRLYCHKWKRNFHDKAKEGENHDRYKRSHNYIYAANLRGNQKFLRAIQKRRDQEQLSKLHHGAELWLRPARQIPPQSSDGANRSFSSTAVELQEPDHQRHWDELPALVSWAGLQPL